MRVEGLEVSFRGFGLSVGLRLQVWVAVASWGLRAVPSRV